MINAPLSLQPMGSPDISAVYQLNGQDLELLSKFQARTVLTIGTDKSSRIYQNEVIKLACSVSPLGPRSASNTNFDVSASVLDACGTGVDIDP
jgi:hypothetical protein